MRKAQITVKLDLFGDLAWDGHHEEIGVYADAQTPHEALAAALYELLGALRIQGHPLPGFGCREHRCTPSAAGLTEEQKAEIRNQRREERERQETELWEYFDSQKAASEAPVEDL